MTDGSPQRRSWVLIGCILAVPAVIGAFAIVMVVQAFHEVDQEKRMPAAERAQKRAAALAVVTKYTGSLAGAYRALAAKTPGDFHAMTDCRGATLSPPPDPSHTVSAVYGPFLQRFTQTNATWSREQGDWAFLTDNGIEGHFEKNPRDQSFDEIRDAANRVTDTYLPARYLVVIWPEDESRNHLSMRTSLAPDDVLRAGDHYTPGEFHGWLAVVDQTSGAVPCVSRLDAAASDTILHRHNEQYPHPLHTKYQIYDAERDAAKEVRADFEKNLKRAVEHAMPDGLTASVGFGPLF